MTPKAWADKLKKWRKDKADQYARTILVPPTKTTLYRTMPFPGVVVLMGERRYGKSGLAHEVANQFHNRRHVDAVLHLPGVPETTRKKVQKMLPGWFKVVTRRSQWPENCVVVYDEAAQSAHARRSQSGQAVELDDLVGLSGQRRQLIIFIAHHSRKLDLNVITEVNRIVWKKPSYAHQLWERSEISDFSMRAFDFFQGIKGTVTQKRTTLVLDMDNFTFLRFTNSLPPWWTENLSRLFRDIELRSKGVG